MAETHSLTHRVSTHRLRSFFHQIVYSHPRFLLPARIRGYSRSTTLHHDLDYT